MARIILAREEDKGGNRGMAFMVVAMSLVCGLVGIPIGAILSRVMQDMLHNSSAPVMYGFFIAPILIGMFIGAFFMMKELHTKNRTICEKCKAKMYPMTERDALFTIPVRGEETYGDAFHYLAKNMVRVSSFRDIPFNQRGCYVCCYECKNCANRMIRIKDFLPLHGTYTWMEAYYYDYLEFSKAREKNDLL